MTNFSRQGRGASYCASQQDISRVHTRAGSSVLATGGACLTCFSADATTMFDVVRCADCFTCVSAAKAETVKKAALANTIFRARIAFLLVVLRLPNHPLSSLLPASRKRQS